MFHNKLRWPLRAKSVLGRIDAHVWGVGTNGTILRGYQPSTHPVSSFGSLTPNLVATVPVYQLTANTTTNIFRLAFGTEGNLIKIFGTDTVEVTVEGYNDNLPLTLTWSGTTESYDLTDSALVTYVDSLLYQRIAVLIRPQAAWIKLAPDTYTYPETVIGETASANFTLRNIGWITATGISASLSGDNPDNFSITQAPPATLDPKVSVTIPVQFAPTFPTGMKAAHLDVASTNSTDVASTMNGMASIGDVETRFIMTVRTTTPSESFTLPLFTGSTYNFNVDWGDGTNEDVTTDTDVPHVYADAGDYQIIINGTFPQIYFYTALDANKVISIDNLGAVGWISFYRAFRGCSNLTTVTLGDFDVTGVLEFTSMFGNCTSLLTIDVSNLITSGVTHINEFFGSCSSLQTITGLDTWDVQNVIYFNSAFSFGPSGRTLDLSSWDVSSGGYMQGMFRNTPNLTLIGLENWNTASLINTNSMFVQGSLTHAYPGVTFDVSNVTDAGDMYRETTLADATYDEILTAWSAQTVQADVSFHAGTAKYTKATERAILTDPPNNWIITDGGPA